jgi:hypothetical protein
VQSRKRAPRFGSEQREMQIVDVEVQDVEISSTLANLVEQ